MQRQPLAEKIGEENCSKIIVKKEEETDIKVAIKKEEELKPGTSKDEKTEQELSEVERKQKIKEELGEEVLRDIEAAEGSGSSNAPQEPCKKCKDKIDKPCKECGCQVPDYNITFKIFLTASARSNVRNYFSCCPGF